MDERRKVFVKQLQQQALDEEMQSMEIDSDNRVASRSPAFYHTQQSIPSVVESEDHEVIGNGSPPPGTSLIATKDAYDDIPSQPIKRMYVKMLILKSVMFDREFHL